MDGIIGRISNLERTSARVETKLDNVMELLQVLARLEERQAHINDRLADGARTMGELRERVSMIERELPKRGDSRLGDLEREIPPLKETRNDIRKLNWFVIAALVAALLSIILGART